MLLTIPSERGKAESILRKCHEWNADHIETAHLLGMFYYEKKDYANAIQVIGKVMHQNVPTELKQLLCECYLKNGDTIPYLTLHHLIE